MAGNSVATLYRASYKKKDEGTPSGIKWLDKSMGFLDKLFTILGEDGKIEIRCFILSLADESNKSFDYKDSTTELSALKNAINFAFNQGYYADTKQIALFSKKKIDTLFLQRNSNFDEG